ncbi:MAG: class I SAM-dependent methyltransferase [Clostridiales bacterium]|nr:class I SAM-dependent methyltransferase [Clostridiales bacterium]
MNTQLELIAKSYDKAIELGRQGIDLYNDLPECITSDPDYPIFQKMSEEGGSSDSKRKEIREYLSPDANMKFIDLGCCLNLMFGGYDEWPSSYHGVDISSKTIQLLHEFVAGKELPLGSLYCASIHATPFDANYFEIGACIGVLEYFEKDFVVKAIMEAHRIINPDGKLVLDVPDMGSPEYRITMKLRSIWGELINLTCRHKNLKIC